MSEKNREQQIWSFLERHLKSIFTRDAETYGETTSADLSLYEWFVTPHRQDGLDFHFFMIDHDWSGAGDDFRFDLLERRLQLYDQTAIVSYTFMFTAQIEGQIVHRSHNESRVLIEGEHGWQVVHVHKSPSWQAPREPDHGQA